jgi:hypothetical protein
MFLKFFDLVICCEVLYIFSFIYSVYECDSVSFLV